MVDLELCQVIVLLLSGKWLAGVEAVSEVVRKV